MDAWDAPDAWRGLVIVLQQADKAKETKVSIDNQITLDDCDSSNWSR